MGGHGKWEALGEGHIPVEDFDKGLGHIVSRKTYNAVFVSLLCLTFFTVLAATVDLGWFNVPLALLIASTKATIVGLFFMHLNYENKFIWGAVITPIIIIIVLFLGTLGDEVIKENIKPLTPFVEADKSQATKKGHG